MNCGCHKCCPAWPLKHSDGRPVSCIADWGESRGPLAVQVWASIDGGLPRLIATAKPGEVVVIPPVLGWGAAYALIGGSGGGSGGGISPNAPAQKIGAPSGWFWTWPLTVEAPKAKPGDIAFNLDPHCDKCGVSGNDVHKTTCPYLRLDFSNPCTASPTCGLPDEQCPVCRKSNCPGMKCWGCGR